MKKELVFLFNLCLFYPALSMAQPVLWNLADLEGAESAVRVEVDPLAYTDVVAGDVISLVLESGLVEKGMVTAIEKIESGTGTRLIGSLASEKGSAFSLDIAGNQLTGIILRPADNLGYRITRSAQHTVLEKLAYTDLICGALPLPAGDAPDYFAAESRSKAQTNAAPVASVPVFSSNSEAAHVLYLDFDGETIINSIWNAFYTEGEPIVAQPYSTDADPETFSSQEVGFIRRVWRGIRDAYSIYEVNVTTDRAVFDSTPVAQRQMAIITPTYEWMPGFPGGRAIQNSFGVDNRPVFGFLNGLLNQSRWMAMALSHEFGHAFDLAHDGLNGQDLHPGQGQSVSNAYGWGPIMGAAYNAFYLTWSNGDYAGSTNTEDDIAKIGARIPFKDDRVADSNVSATVLGASRLRRTVGFNDTDVYQVYAEKEQRISATVTVEGQYPTLNSQLLLYTASGQLVAQSSPPPTIPDQIATQNSAISYRAPQSGTYFLHVKGAGFDGGVGYSHSAYGAVGDYQILASIKDAPSGDSTIVPILNILLMDDEN